MPRNAFALTHEPDTAEPARDGARDPRRNPQPGDVLAAGVDVREVFTRLGSRVEYGFPRKSATRWLDLLGWQAWARNADVRSVARG